MSDHRIQVTLDLRVGLRLSATCSAGASALCRAVNVDPACDCETWSIDVDEDGPFHEAYAEDDDGTQLPHVRHRMRFDGTSCSTVDYLVSYGYTDLYGGAPVVIADLAVEFDWDSDGGTWDLASDVRTPRAGDLMVDHVAGQLTVDDVLTEHGATP